ncbi:MAG TPA: hypothetical protein DE179_09545 [Oceanospirillaceae bacterium]|nr:hypothetical protein [Oceanospirillaceae bacterium]
MTKLSNEVLQQALALSSQEKAQIIEGLLASLDTPGADIDSAWAAEVDARVDAYDKGQLSSVSVADVLGKYARVDGR